jgi:hypothetical protein
MKVTLKDLRKLEDDVSEQIQELSLIPNTDFDRLAELRTLSFNISMLFLRHSMEKDSTEIELGNGESDRLIIEALKPIRVRDVQKKIRSFDYIDNISDMALELIQRIDELKTGMKGSRSILFENIMYRLNTSRDYLSDIARLKEDEALLDLWKKNRIQGVQLAASVLGQSRSTRKSEAARENGKKGGRPKNGGSRKILDENGVFVKESSSSSAKKSATVKKSAKTVDTRKKTLAKSPKSVSKAGAKKKSG